MVAVDPTHQLLWFLLLDLLFWNVQAYRPNNYTLIRLINSMNGSWKAGENPTNVPWPNEVALEERVEPILPFLKTPEARVDLPIFFSAARKFGACEDIIERIPDQGECNSSWALVTASVMSDRLCISSNGTIKVHISGEDLLTCCSQCWTGKEQRHSCKGGSVQQAFEYLEKHGVVTGGDVSSKEECKPYSATSYGGKHKACQRKCTNRAYGKGYKRDIYHTDSIHRVPTEEDHISQEIYRNGPVIASFTMRSDFHQYKKDVYQWFNGQNEGTHYLKIIGWGVMGTFKYWLAINSQGKEWGEKGKIKFIRGVDDCGIERNVLTLRPRLEGAFYERMVGAESSGQSLLQKAWKGFVLMEIMALYVYKCLQN